MRTNILKIAGSLAFALAATPAFAHAQLEKATPPVGGTVSPPKRNPARVQRGRRAEIHQGHAERPRRRPAPLGAAKTEPGNQAVLIVPISKPLSAGVYTVRWQAVSVDTHHTQGTFEFTVKP